MQNIKKLNCAFIGLGPHGIENLLPSIKLSKFLKLALLISRNAEKVERFCYEYDCPSWASDIQTAYESQEIDVVIVSGPPYIHEQCLILASKYQKPTFVEKPPTLSLETLQKLVHQLNHSNTYSFVGYNFRYSDSFTSVVNYFNDTNIRQLNINFIANKPQSPMWGLKSTLESYLFAVAIHAIELATNLLGQPIKTHSFYQPTGGGRFSLHAYVDFEGGRSASFKLGNFGQKFHSLYEFIAENGKTAQLIDMRQIQLESGKPYEFSKKEILYAMPSPLKGGYYESGYSRELEQMAQEIAQSKPSSSALSKSIPTYQIISQIIQNHAKEI